MRGTCDGEGKGGGAARGKDRHWYNRAPAMKDSLIRYSLFDENDDMEGYIYFTVENRKFYIKELVYSSLDAKKEILHFVYRHRAQATEVDWMVPPDDNFFLLIGNPKGSINKTITGKMLRVVDVQRVLELIAFDPAHREDFTIKVEDSWLPWNNQTFAVSVKNGKADVKISQSRSADLECTIQTFSQISIGYLSMKDAVELDKISIKNEEKINRIQKLFPRKTTYINEQF